MGTGCVQTLKTGRGRLCHHRRGLWRQHLGFSWALMKPLWKPVTGRAALVAASSLSFWGEGETVAETNSCF